MIDQLFMARIHKRVSPVKSKLNPPENIPSLENCHFSLFSNFARNHLKLYLYFEMKM